MNWKEIGFTNGVYSVSDCGLVRRNNRQITYSNGRKNIHKLRILTPLIKCGYHYVAISINGKVKHYPVHTLMCMEFIPNPNNKPQVNHKDGKKKIIFYQILNGVRPAKINFTLFMY